MKKIVGVILFISILTTLTSCSIGRSTVERYEAHLVEYKTVSFEEGLQASIDESAKLIGLSSRYLTKESGWVGQGTISYPEINYLNESTLIVAHIHEGKILYFWYYFLEATINDCLDFIIIAENQLGPATSAGLNQEDSSLVDIQTAFEDGIRIDGFYCKWDIDIGEAREFTLSYSTNSNGSVLVSMTFH